MLHHLQLNYTLLQLTLHLLLPFQFFRLQKVTFTCTSNNNSRSNNNSSKILTSITTMSPPATAASSEASSSSSASSTVAATTTTTTTMASDQVYSKLTVPFRKSSIPSKISAGHKAISASVKKHLNDPQLNKLCKMCGTKTYYVFCSNNGDINYCDSCR